MKYCTKCGNKLNENARFCNKCGNPTSIVLKEREESLKVKKEENKEKLLLLLGTFLVIIASIIFAVINWEEMTNIFKILFLLMESLIFLSLSIFSKKLNYIMPHKFLWFIGIIFIPIILNLLPEYNLLGNFSNGNSLFVYLALSSLICFITYVLSYKFIKSNIFLYIGYIFIYSVIENILCIFNLKTLNYIIPVLNLFNLAICIFYIYIKNDSYKNTIRNFISVSLIIFSIITSAFLLEYSKSINTFVLLITTLSVIISIMIILFRNHKHIPIYFYPLCVYSLIVSLASSVFINYDNVSLFLSVLGVLFTYLIMSLKEDKAYNIVSYIFMILFLISNAFIFFNCSYITVSIISTIILISLLFTLKIYENNSFQSYVTKLIIPINIFIIINSITNSIVIVDGYIPFLISSIICFITYVIIDKKNIDNFFSYTLSIASYILLGISGLIIIYIHPIILFFILNEVLWLTYFIYNSIINNHKDANIVLLIISILNFIVIGSEYNIDIYYSLLFVSTISLIFDIGLFRQKRKTSPYIYISLVSSTLASLYKFSNLALIGVGLNVIIYILSYYIITRRVDINSVIKYIYTFVGFILINSVLVFFIKDLLLSNIITLIIYLFIMISMYLLRTMSDRKVFGLYILISIPYISIINQINISNTLISSLNLLLFVSIVLIYFERVFNLKEVEKIVFELILLGLAHLFTIHIAFIFNLFLCAFYIFYGFYKKRDSFVIFGIVLLFTSILINVWKIFDNLPITFALMIVGFTMLSYVFYIEAKKKKKNNK